MYSYEEFYAVSTDKKADIFFCPETMKEYVPYRSMSWNRKRNVTEGKQGKGGEKIGNK